MDSAHLADKNPVGRPPKFATPEAMQIAIDAYFAECAQLERPYTISGLAYSLGMSTQALRNYEEKDEFLGTIKRAKQVVENALETRLYGAGCTGAIFNLKNNFGWKDQTEVHQTGDDIEALRAELRALLN